MKYELCFIISPAIPETEHPSVNKDILGYLKDAEAKINKEPYFMGRKKLAYAIQKQKHGFYVFLEFQTEEKQALKDLNVKLKHDNRLLRYLIIKLDKAINYSVSNLSNFNAQPAEMGDRKKILKRAPFKPKPPFKTIAKTEDKESAIKETKRKVSLDDIDKKLDEILKEPKID